MIVKSLVVELFPSLLLFSLSLILFLKLQLLHVGNQLFLVNFLLFLYLLDLLVVHLVLERVKAVVLETLDLHVLLCLSFSHHALVGMTSVLLPVDLFFQFLLVRRHHLLRVHLLTPRQAFVVVVELFLVVLLSFNHFSFVFVTGA